MNEALMTLFLYIESFLLIETVMHMSASKLKEIASVLATTHDQEQIEAFLKSILTKNEVDEISTRWELVKLLDGGMSQRKIADRLEHQSVQNNQGIPGAQKSPFAFQGHDRKIQGNHKTTAGEKTG